MAKKATTTKTPSKKPQGGKGNLRTRAFGEAVDAFGKEIAPLGPRAGAVARRVGDLLLGMVEGAVFGFEYVSNWLQTAVAHRLRNVDQENIVEPNPRIAVPAVQALVYSMQEVAIRDMFANLLAASMNKDKREQAHPAFVEIIKEMTPSEAKVLDVIAGRSQLAYRIIYSGGHRHDIETVYSIEIADVDMAGIRRAISNLQRLGVVVVKLKEWPIIKGFNDTGKDRFELKYEKMYEDKLTRLKSDPAEMERIGLESNSRLDIEKSGVFLTPLGEHFVASCLTE